MRKRYACGCYKDRPDHAPMNGSILCGGDYAPAKRSISNETDLLTIVVARALAIDASKRIMARVVADQLSGNDLIPVS